MLCFSAQFRETPSGWRTGHESYADALLRGLSESPLDYLNTLRGSFVMAWYHSGHLHLIRDRCGRFSTHITHHQAWTR